MMFEYTEDHGSTKPKVLVVEDDSMQRRILTLILNHIGFSDITEAPDGVSGLQSIANSARKFDVVICDVQMDGMDGITFIRNLNKANIGCMALTSALEDHLLISVEAMIQAQGIPILGRLPKPITAKAVERLLDKYSRSSSQSTYPMACPNVTRWSNADLQDALRREQFEPFFQPKVDIKSYQIIGVEVLARWRHPSAGIIGPAQFISKMEEAGLIADLTRQLFQHALTSWRKWHQAGVDLSLAINASPLMLQTTDVLRDLTKAAKDGSFEPGKIVIEVTESAVANNYIDLLETLTRLRLAGFGLSIDDYGTGYSSLQQLSRIPFTELKIDRTFVLQASRSEKSRAIVESTLLLAKRLGLVSVAEGVEIEADLELLRQMGCDMAQGFYFAKPMPAEELLPWVANKTISGVLNGIDTNIQTS